MYIFNDEIVFDVLLFHRKSSGIQASRVGPCSGCSGRKVLGIQ